jgi:hypothetical protein
VPACTDLDSPKLAYNDGLMPLKPTGAAGDDLQAIALFDLGVGRI